MSQSDSETENEQQIYGNYDSDEDFSDFENDYPTIKNAKQRRTYNEHYNAHLEEHKKLLSYITKVARRFQFLNNKLKQTVKDSPQYYAMQNRISRQFAFHYSDQKKKKLNDRYVYLHEKLQHLKDLIRKYDEETLIRKMRRKRINGCNTTGL